MWTAKGISGSLALLAAIVFGQQQQTYVTHSDGNGTNALVPVSHSDLPTLPGLKISWYTGLDKRMIWMRVENVSGRNINAYNIKIGVKYADGSKDYDDKFFPSEHMETFALVPFNGTDLSFAAGAVSRDQPIAQADKEVSEIVAVPDVIVYTDDTAEVHNERAFKQIMATRKGAVLALEKVSETIKRVLADAVPNPADAVTEELTRFDIALGKKHAAPEEPENNEEQSLRNQIGQFQNAEQIAQRMNMTEREYLTQMAEDLDKQIALMKPHCDVKVVPQ